MKLINLSKIVYVFLSPIKIFAYLNTEERLSGQDLSFVVVVVFVKYKTACQISNQTSLQKGLSILFV